MVGRDAETEVKDLRAGLDPDLLARVDRILAQMAAEGHPMRICSGLRTAAEQARLWAQGRTLPGRRVTYADGIHKKSNHQSGRAVDCCFLGPEPFGEHHPWSRYGQLARLEGLTWGGDWRTPDRPHVELTLSADRV